MRETEPRKHRRPRGALTPRTVQPVRTDGMAHAVGAPAVRARDLRKSYGGRTAVDGVSFDVARGECFGLLGPNGAGKSTTIRMIWSQGARGDRGTGHREELAGPQGDGERGRLPRCPVRVRRGDALRRLVRPPAGGRRELRARLRRPGRGPAVGHRGASDARVFGQLTEGDRVVDGSNTTIGISRSVRRW